MNPTIKQQWLHALRSGKYKQGKGCLRRADNTFCCLGVLCDVVDSTKWVDNDVRHLFTYKFKGNNQEASLPDNLLSFLGVNDVNPDINIDEADAVNYKLYHAGSYSLATLNDRHSLTFSQIADIIEKYL